MPIEQLTPDRHTQYSSSSSSQNFNHEDVWTDLSCAHVEVGSDLWTGRTTFFIQPPPSESQAPDSASKATAAASCEWTAKQLRSVRSGARKAMQEVTKPGSQVKSPIYDVIEVFSPPRFGLLCTTRGLSCLSADLVSGWDFRRPGDRDAIRSLIRDHPPKLLVLCPPCTWAGGWFNLNRLHMTPEERRQKEMLTRLFLNFCAELAELQLENGGRVVFEHPVGSVAWSLPRWQKLGQRMHQVDLDMRCYGLCVPSGVLIKKATRLLVSHANMRCLGKRCPGPRVAEHVKHQVAQGSFPGVGSVSKEAGKYPPAFVRAVMRTVTELPKHSVCLVQTSTDEECLMARRVAALNEQQKDQMRASIRKLHSNLGHPPNSALVRVLRHGGANQAALDMAREFTCEQCQASKQPSPANPAQCQRVTTFNQRIGLDVKYLPGWMPNQKIPSLNIVDYASSFQVVVPLPGRETGESLRQALQERWISWAGMPAEIVVDPAQTNLSEALTTPQELAGAVISTTAAEAHWQLGKVEVHGGWFARVLDKVLSDCAPRDRHSWQECVTGAHCKNELIQVYGMTPAQFVFGRNPRVPANLLDEPLSVVPATASLYEDAVARQVAVRQSARQAVIALQDDKALRLGLAARPRKIEVFQPGQWVAYWRTQKSHQGVIERGGRWYGPAVVLGYVGKNVVVIHKRQIFRRAPEQVRRSTSEEQSLTETPQLELLGIKDLLDSKAITSKQYVDLVPEGLPEPEPPQVDPNTSSNPAAQVPARLAEPSAASAGPQPAELRPADSGVVGSGSGSSGLGSGLSGCVEGPGSELGPLSSPYPNPNPKPTQPSDGGDEYGPVRRVTGKKPPQETLFRPRVLLQDDFAEMMHEALPELIARALNGEQQQANPPMSSAAQPLQENRGQKREASSEPPASSGKRPARDPASATGDAASSTDVLVVQCYENFLVQAMQEKSSVEALVASHVNRQVKEVPATGNPSELQAVVDEAKSVEWNTVSGRDAVRLVLGAQADAIRKHSPERIMGSRFVMTWKHEEDAAPRMKGRWCLQGHLDPDLREKALSGDLQSPTLSQVGRSMLMQLIASHRWDLRLGDIKGAFLASGELPPKYRPLYARLPPGGIPGVPSDALIEVVGHVYGLNDAPSAWYRTLDRALLKAGFERSRFDPCIYYMRDNDQIVGIYGVHVDDCATGGAGRKYEEALKSLKETFEFRKWRLGDGDFCGAHYWQDPQTHAITMTQGKFAEKLRPLHLSRKRLQQRESPLTADEIRCLRAINGSLNWLSTQSRPDLSTQVSFSQQSFPTPTVGDALAANNAIRRAKQHASLPIVFEPIVPEQLAVMGHSDAAYANGREGATQAGYLVSFTDKAIDKGSVCSWTPAYWKSYRLPRVVNSTLSAEAQAMATASGMIEWIMLLLSEALDGKSFLRSAWQTASRRASVLLTDCKSLYDHLSSRSAPTLDDKRTSLDVIIIRDSILKLGASLRWIPTDRMLADSMTKESQDAMDLLRACIRTRRYQISDEGSVLEWRAAERQRRQARVVPQGV